jgi:hypothetical protein
LNTIGHASRLGFSAAAVLGLRHKARRERHRYEARE